MSYIKNTAGQFLGFLLVNCCGKPVESAEVTAVRSIDGGIQEPVDGTVTELDGGQYILEMD